MTSLIKVKKGSVIFWEGAQENWMYDIRWGSVAIFANYQETGEQKLATMEAGAYFGEMGLIEEARRSATAVALTDCQLLKITEADFQEYCQEHPGKVLSIMQQISGRMRALTGDYMKVSKLLAEYNKAQEAGEEIPSELMKAMKQVAAKAKK